MKDFYKFFKYNGKILDIIDFEEEYLKIFSREILKQIKEGKSGWENTSAKRSCITCKEK